MHFFVEMLDTAEPLLGAKDQPGWGGTGKWLLLELRSGAG